MVTDAFTTNVRLNWIEASVEYGDLFTVKLTPPNAFPIPMNPIDPPSHRFTANRDFCSRDCLYVHLTQLMTTTQIPGMAGVK
jgi:hypothetical protein